MVIQNDEQLADYKYDQDYESIVQKYETSYLQFRKLCGFPVLLTYMLDLVLKIVGMITGFPSHISLEFLHL